MKPEEVLKSLNDLTEGFHHHMDPGKINWAIFRLLLEMSERGGGNQPFDPAVSTQSSGSYGAGSYSHEMTPPTKS